MMGWNGGMMNGYVIGMGFIGWLVQLALFIAVIYLAFVLIKRVNNKSEDTNRYELILKERFARGDITEEEYNKMKKVLHD
ncbi:SHOCT domain-containing protein [Sporolactobacillus nakayamae]|uniref:Putative membrane protein n=1 Tax=Sporolactobacillus nakayamae TaxID=269670 RepID=A0A1I2VY91_9BACL|nr:SHOCT domain-containing protein [Sporolactobacillus nakayamae]SFG93307.1 putative membrane protein [Sporolactobacillus nakayamae]